MGKFRQNRKYVSPNQKSIDAQKGLDKDTFRCTQCDEIKPKTEGYRNNWYWCKPCFSKYQKKRPKKVSYNQLW